MPVRSNVSDWRQTSAHGAIKAGNLPPGKQSSNSNHSTSRVTKSWLSFIHLNDAATNCVLSSLVVRVRSSVASDGRMYGATYRQ